MPSPVSVNILQSRPWGVTFTDTVKEADFRLCLCWTQPTPNPKMALLEQGDNAPTENCHRLVILGSSKVGKTSIVSRFLSGKYEENYTPTIEDFHRKVYRIKGEAYRLDILDTSGNHPFPAMRRLSFITGDLFILVYSIDNRDSFDEVSRLHHQILECKAQCKSSTRKLPTIPMMVIGNKCDKEPERVIDKSEALKLTEGQSNCGFIEASAKKNINIDEIFISLFDIANLPTEMSPSMHRRVHPTYVSGSTNSNGKKGVSIRRKMSDACGAIAPNVRRPSIRTDLLVAQMRTSQRKHIGSEGREQKCVIQ